MRRFFDGAHRWELPACLAVTLIPPAIALPFSPPAALGLLIGLLIGNGLHLWGLSRRRRQMRQLSQELSGLLRGETSLSLEDYREGELAILRDELQKLLTQLQHSNTALRKDRMLLADSLADISHQLRTPLTSMELMVSLLRSPEVPEQKRRQLLRDLEKLLQRTEWLIEALLKLSGWTPGPSVSDCRITPCGSWFGEQRSRFRWRWSFGSNRSARTCRRRICAAIRCGPAKRCPTC